nr:hypothetical protein Iba_chr13cCG9900 [Ipomoea batatas]
MASASASTSSLPSGVRPLAFLYRMATLFFSQSQLKWQLNSLPHLPVNNQPSSLCLPIPPSLVVAFLITATAVGPSPFFSLLSPPSPSFFPFLQSATLCPILPHLLQKLGSGKIGGKKNKNTKAGGGSRDGAIFFAISLGETMG